MLNLCRWGLSISPTLSQTIPHFWTVRYFFVVIGGMSPTSCILSSPDTAKPSEKDKLQVKKRWFFIVFSKRKEGWKGLKNEHNLSHSWLWQDDDLVSFGKKTVFPLTFQSCMYAFDPEILQKKMFVPSYLPNHTYILMFPQVFMADRNEQKYGSRFSLTRRQAEKRLRGGYI